MTKLEIQRHYLHRDDNLELWNQIKCPREWVAGKKNRDLSPGGLRNERFLGRSCQCAKRKVKGTCYKVASCRSDSGRMVWPPVSKKLRKMKTAAWLLDLAMWWLYVMVIDNLNHFSQMMVWKPYCNKWRREWKRKN